MTCEEEFEMWWREQGQFCRAGGGEYEKTFAYRAYEAATERAATVCEEEAASHQAMHNTQAEQGADGCATAIRGEGK